MVFSATVHAGVSDSEAAELTERVKISSIPEMNDATDQMLYAVEIANNEELVLHPDRMCQVLNSLSAEDVPEDFREMMERHLRQGTHA
jgi:N-dimethylarginine dimethylaminohydrolase